MAMATQRNKGMVGSTGNGDERVWKLLRIVGWSGAALIMLLPLIGNAVSDEVDWSLSDFVFAAIILGGIGLTFELAIRQSRDNAYRAGVVMALGALFLLIWSNAAVGFVGSGANAANVLYFAMIGIPFLGAIVSGFQAKGLFITMLLTAIAQALITLFAFSAGLVGDEESMVILAINGFFIVLWIASAVLFRRAAQTQERHV